MNKFKEIRKTLGMKQATVARSLKVAQSTVSMWERGLTFPTGKMLIRVADIYGCTTDELLGRETKDV